MSILKPWFVPKPPNKTVTKRHSKRSRKAGIYVPAFVPKNARQNSSCRDDCPQCVVSFPTAKFPGWLHIDYPLECMQKSWRRHWRICYAGSHHQLCTLQKMLRYSQNFLDKITAKP